jgi:hypothetical protein
MKLLRLSLTLSAMLAAPGAALAQVDYSAAKSGPQLFSSDCSACHQSPQGLAKGRDPSALSSFLREHYTTGGASAGKLANYLAGLPAGRQPAARGSQAPGATATAPAGGAPRPPAAVEAERPKPGDARKPKPTTTEAEREPANPAPTQAEGGPGKPAAIDPLSSKLRGYATTGESAMPVAAAAPQDDVRAVSTPAPADTAKPAEASPAPTEAAPGTVPSASESTPAAPAQPGEPTQSGRPPG